MWLMALEACEALDLRETPLRRLCVSTCSLNRPGFLRAPASRRRFDAWDDRDRTDRPEVDLSLDLPT